jgi:hypothetical protein
LRETAAALARGADDPGLTAAGGDATRLLRPCLVQADVYARLQADALAVTSALEALYAAAREDASLRAALGFDPRLEPLLAFEPVAPAPLVGRLDGLLQPEGQARFLEFNPSPGGTYESAALGRLFAAAPALAAFARTHRVTCPDPLEGAYRALLTAGGGRLPRIAVLGLAGAPQAGEIAQLAAELGRRGLAVYAAAGQTRWKFEGGRLYAGGGAALDAQRDGMRRSADPVNDRTEWPPRAGQPYPGGASLDAQRGGQRGEFDVDVVLFLNPFDVAGFLREHGPGHPLMAALREGAVTFLGGLFRTLFLSSKRVFAALSEPEYRGLLPPRTHEALERCIPTTRLAGGLAGTRERLVLKPPLGYGGAGVTLGWRVSEAEWRHAHAVAIREGWIVQERVAAPREPYPVWRDGRLSMEELWWDLNPYVWGGTEVAGCLVRAGADPLLNTSAGTGSSTALFVLEDPDP